ncbi:MAG: tyrosine--tRNA ligase [Clostridiales bacterium]|jgi:tyrosyl-tRNA synthetase|nr:tyrosine--tRNA ligase [Clostridiales bacterium]
MNGSDVFKIIKRDAVSIFSEADLMEKLCSGRQLTVKLGADPSAPDLHLGHSVVLRKLKLLQNAGHRIVFVIGDFTGMIGDPSGRKKTRAPLTFEQTRLNGQTYFTQAAKILDPKRTVIAYNSEWLSKMGFADVLKLAGKYTLARILERDDFADRFQDNQPIVMQELFYPLMQGYDSVALRADIEVGGSDQTFNLLVGRELQRDYGQQPQEVITFPLLPGLDGTEKMSKSLGNYIGIDEPADIMFEKCMRVPDALLGDYFRLTTNLSDTEYSALLSLDIRKAHLLYAETVTGMYHDKASSEHARQRYQSVARGGIPEDIETLAFPSGQYPLWKLVYMAGLAKTGSEARRLILEGGISLDGGKVTDPAVMPACTDSVLLKRGKSRFVSIRFV